MSEVVVLLGDEAIAQGALDAGISGCYAYPGTPSTEIMEFVRAAPETRERGIHAEWSSNEKTAMEEALGMSYAGKRALVCMKHVGLNVAADGFVNSAISGVHGGVVVLVADDPSMHSSQNEQDSRFYAKFARTISLEPSNQQEAYEAVRAAFPLSEETELPVLVRITTRLAHSRADIRRGPVLPQNSLSFPESPRRFVLLPAIARQNYTRLLDKQPDLERRAVESAFNDYRDAPDRSLGILACGIAHNYLMENYPGGECPHPVLKLVQYPLPAAMVTRLLSECETVLVLEEGAPVVEEQLHGPLGRNEAIRGRMTGDLPREGELNPDVVAQALGLPAPTGDATLAEESAAAPKRPPRLCDGCPHIASYKALVEALQEYSLARVFSDIGCYTLGALPPFDAIHTCIDMGASVSMAKGAADAGVRPAVAVIGDSTFTHSGMTPLLDGVWESTPMTVLILDNSTTGMTGGQDSLGSGRFRDIVAGIGVPDEHIHEFDPLPKNHDENVRLLRQAFDYEGLSVVIARRECIQTLRRRRGR